MLSTLRTLISWFFRSFHPKTTSQKQRPSLSTDDKTSYLTLHERILQQLTDHYDLRYNLLTEEPEYRPKDTEQPFRTIDRLAFNTLAIHVVDANIGAWPVDIERILHSNAIPRYQPLAHYLQQLPTWDGIDRVTPLAHRINTGPVWTEAFHIWLRAMVAQWTQHPMTTANALVPILISQQQGMRKSTFCRMLMPPPLTPYYNEHLNLTAAGNIETQLAKLGLINLDEFDRYTPRQTATLKNILQLPHVCRRRAYRQQLLSLPRLASFIATSNEREILTDPTGSRRFLCVEITAPIDCTPIAHEQLYAQLLAEVRAGAPTFLHPTLEKRLQRHNRAFQQPSPATEILWHVFRRHRPNEAAPLLTATEIFEHLTQTHPAAMRSLRPHSFGRILRSQGLIPRHTRHGNAYPLVAKE